MNDTVNQVFQGIQTFFAWIGKIIGTIWAWSFGKVWEMFQTPFTPLPLWKQVIYIIAILAIIYFLYGIAMALWEAVKGIFEAVVRLLREIVEQIPSVIIAALIAIVCAWIIREIDVGPLFTDWHIGG